MRDAFALQGFQASKNLLTEELKTIFTHTEEDIETITLSETSMAFLSSVLLPGGPQKFVEGLVRLFNIAKKEMLTEAQIEWLAQSQVAMVTKHVDMPGSHVNSA